MDFHCHQWINIVAIVASVTIGSLWIAFIFNGSPLLPMSPLSAIDRQWINITTGING
jgi:hypothetical protein